jgi:hypothetical protein
VQKLFSERMCRHFLEDFPRGIQVTQAIQEVKRAMMFSR